ncbi:MAG: tetraacyldisaccharide 4'-kinase, partial [Candidatus Omnitrophica bacterium]|nr:tetraacyldisaccharide 4'-kinase [Candidatus Omnitrophota bacterium]
VEYIASLLKEKGRGVAILTRGYGTGEEARMLEENLEGLPVIIDSDRFKGARRAIKEYFADTLILDDGFQQWRLAKDLDIAVIDATNPFGNRNMLPRGILREPLSSLKRADIFMLTKTDMAADLNKLKAHLQRLNSKAEIFDSVHKPVSLYRLDKKSELLPLGFLKGKTVAIFCGIGDPASFESLIRSAGAQVAAFFKYPDHHDYTDADLEGIISGAREKNIETIITTEKDAARITNSGLNDYNSSFFALRVELEIKENERFVKRLFGLYSV